MAPKGKKSRTQRRTENKALTSGSAGSAAPPWPPPATKKVETKGGKGGKGGKGRKGEGKGGKFPLPANVKRQTAAGKHICFCFNKK